MSADQAYEGVGIDFETAQAAIDALTPAISALFEAGACVAALRPEEQSGISHYEALRAIAGDAQLLVEATLAIKGNMRTASPF